ncbi:17736_t:CDS:2, partial [Funneliformis geosporum]
MRIHTVKLGVLTVQKYHPDKDPKSKKAKILIAEGQSTLDGFVGQIEIPPKVRFRTSLTKWVVSDDQLFTTSKNQHFQSITMHWITKDWMLQDSLLDFIDLCGPHSSENLCNAFVKSCQEFVILKK